MEELLSVFGFVLNVYDNLTILIFNEDVYERQFFKIVFCGELYFRMSVLN